MKKVNVSLFVLHILVGIGAMAGGLSGLLNPRNPMGASVDLLKNSPFTNFFIPCLLLFTVIGCGNIFSAIMFKFKSKYQGYISSVFGWALVIWIVVQCIMLRTVVALHVIFFVIGCVQAILAAILLFKEKLFPTNIIIKVYKNMKSVN